MLFELEIECNSDECHWILMKFGGVHGEYVLMLPCENELNRRGSKIHVFGVNIKTCVTRTSGDG